MSVKRGWCPFWPGFWTDRSKNSENEDVIPGINLILTVFLNYRLQELSRRKPENRKVQTTTFVSEEPEFISIVMLRDVLLNTNQKSLLNINISSSELKFSQIQFSYYRKTVKCILPCYEMDLDKRTNLPANLSFLDRLSNIRSPYDFELPKW